MALTYTSNFKGQDNGVSATITSDALTIATGDVITVCATSDKGEVDSWTVGQDAGTTITWTKIGESAAAINNIVTLFYGIAGATPPSTINVQAATGANLLRDKTLFVVVHTGANVNNPVPLGNIFSGSSGTDVSKVITPTSNDSALWMVASDWITTNSFVVGANCTFEAAAWTDAAINQTTVPIRPTTQPRIDTTAFEIGETDTSGKISWVVWEVQGGIPAVTYNPKRLNTRDLNKRGFRSNVLRRGQIAWRESVYRDLNPQATNPALPHVTSGDLTGQGSTIVGSAAHKVKHTTTGVLTGQSSTIVGSAAHKVKHPTTGVLAGLVSTIVGAARRFRSHATTGALTGQGSVIVGSAAHKAKHITTGALTGPGSSIVGTARRFITHVTSGVLTGQGSVIDGSASRASASNTHATSGVLIGQSSSIAGSAAHVAKHTTTGVLTGQASSIAGTSAHKAKHSTDGALIGQLSVIVGSAVHKVKHATTGALIGFGAIITGVAVNGTVVNTKRFGVAYWKPVEKEEPIEPIPEEVWTEPDLFEKLKETRANHDAIVRKAQQVELMEEQARIRLRKIQDDQIIEMYLRSKR